MTRTYRLKHLPQPEGGRRARRFVDGRLRNPRDLAEEKYLFQLAHVQLGLPCKVLLPENYPVADWGKAPLYRGWRHSHERCLTPELRDQLWASRQGNPFWHLGWTRTLNVFAHPLIGYGLAMVPSGAKQFARKMAYRRSRRYSKRLLRVCDRIRYYDAGECPCDEPFCDLTGVGKYRHTHGPEIDPDSDRSNFDRKSVKAELVRSAWLLTW